VELRLLLAAIRRGAVVLIVGLVVGVAVGFGAYKALPKHYTASSALLIDSGAILIPGQQPFTGDPERYISDQMRILQSQSVAEQVAKQVPGYDAAKVVSAISLTHVTGANAVTVTAKADTAADAQHLANAVASDYLTDRHAGAQKVIDAKNADLQRQIDSLSQRITQLGQANGGQAAQNALLTQYNALINQQAALNAPGATGDNTAITDTASLPTAATGTIGLSAAVGGGGLIGLLIAFVIVLVREVRRPHVMTQGHAEVVLGRDVTASVHAPRHGRRRSSVPRSVASRSPEVTPLAAIIAGAPSTAPQRTVVVTSAVDDAATAVVANRLAAAFVRQGSVVAVVDLMAGEPAARSTPAARTAEDDQSGELAMAGAAGAAEPARNVVPVGRSATAPVQLPDDFKGVARYRAARGGGSFSTDARYYAGVLSSDFDIVIVQAPALLRSGIAAPVSRTADDTVLVVPLRAELESNLRLADAMLHESNGSRVHVVAFSS
jgi:capsular polysaccharide biosynthesis protein